MVRTLRVPLGACIVIGAAALTLAACGGTTIPAAGAAQAVVDIVSKQKKVKPTDVKCPDGVDLEVGAAFDCTFTAPDGNYVAHLKVAEIDGGSPTFDVKTQLAK